MDRGDALIGLLVDRAYANSKARGFHDEPLNIPEKLALIHSEVSEALECYRDREMELRYQRTGMQETYDPSGTGVVTTRLPKPVGFPSELADVVIRVFDLAGRLGIDLEAVILEKMAYNETRPHKHGKVC